MGLSVSYPISTRDTNIIPRALSYYVYHILKHEKVLFCIMNCDVDVVINIILRGMIKG